MYKRIFTAVILMTIFMTGPAWADPHVWTEYAASSFADGDGSKNDPYQIATAEQLALLASDPSAYSGKHFSITADISLDKTIDSEKVDWVPISNFTGTVNGNGHVISGMTISNSSFYAGLFGTVWEGSTISGIVIKGATITSNFASGLLAASVTRSAISDCHVVGDITATGNNTSSIGGLISQVGMSNVSQCSSAGTITASGSDYQVGGLFGSVMDGDYNGSANSTAITIDKCCTAMSLTSNATVGGLVGMLQLTNSGTTLTNCFSCSYIDAQSATNAGGLFGFLNIFNAGATINAQFAGTMAKPTGSEKYGTIFGNCTAMNSEYYVNPTTLTRFQCTYDRWLCNLQTNGAGYDMDSQLTAVTTPVTDTKRYSIPNAAMSGASCTDIYLLCSMPTFITSDATHYFPCIDVTSSFNMTYQDASDASIDVTYALTESVTNLEAKGNTMYPLDPGSALLTVRCKSLERKALLGIAYGTEWSGSTATAFDSGQGTSSDPYLIRTVEQLALAVSDYDNYNRENMYFKLANDLFMNLHLLGEDEEPRSGAKTWSAPRDEFRAILDGDGHTIYGLYVKDDNCNNNTGHGLFPELEGSISHLAVVDSYVWASAAGSSNYDLAAGLLCGRMSDNATIQQCMVHGRVLCDGAAGGMVGEVRSANTLTDCFACVHVGWATSNTDYEGAGMVSCDANTRGTSVQATLTRCVSTGKVEYASDHGFGLVSQGTADGNSCFDKTMMASNFATRTGDYSKVPSDIISGAMLASATNWQTEAHRYPMLKIFADTPYGDLLSMPVLFADGDCAGSITQVFEFPTENVSWQAAGGSTYVDIIASCGAASPVNATGDGTEYLIAQTSGTVKSLATKALRVMSIDVNVSETPGLTFEDSNAETACMAAFDTNKDGKLTLREAVEATPTKFTTFNSNAANVATFRELRYFVGLTALNSGMISGLSNLTAVELPKTVTTIGAGAFNGCTALQSVTMPVAATTASGQSFYGSGIRNIYVEPKNASLVSRSGLLFDKSDNLMAYPPDRGETAATVSGSLATINAYAFYQVPQLTSIYIDYPKPEGAVATLITNGIVAADGCDISVYINDGSYNGSLYADYQKDASWDAFDSEDRLFRYFPLTVTSAGWATLYIGFATQLPEGMNAYIVTESSVSTNEATLQRVDNLVPTTTPLVVKCDKPGTYLLSPYIGTVDPISKWQNKLIGSYIGQENQWGVPVNQSDTSEGSILTLGRNSNGDVGFFFYRGTLIPPYRAYLTYNNVQSPSAYFSFVINDDTTGIDATLMNSEQRIENSVYDLQGRRVINYSLFTSGKVTLKKGLYIYQSKKVIIK